MKENVRNSRSSGVWRPCALRSSSVHASDPMMELGVGRMITGMVTTREPTMMGQEEQQEQVAAMTTEETEVVLMIVVDNRVMITGSNGLQEEIVLIAAVGTVMHHQQQEPVMEDLQAGPVEDPDLHEMTIEEEHQHKDLMPDLQQTDLTAVEVLVVTTVLVVALTAVPPLPAVVEPPHQDQAGLEETHQYHHAKIDTLEEGQELHQAEIVEVVIIVDHGVVVADRMMG